MLASSEQPPPPRVFHKIKLITWKLIYALLKLSPSKLVLFIATSRLHKSYEYRIVYTLPSFFNPPNVCSWTSSCCYYIAPALTLALSWCCYFWMLSRFRSCVVIFTIIPRSSCCSVPEPVNKSKSEFPRSKQIPWMMDERCLNGG